MGSTSEAAPPCAACEGTAFRAAFAAAGRSFERCRRCGFVRAAAAPSPAELRAFYSGDRASAAAAEQDHDTNLVRFGAIVARLESHAPPPANGRQRRLLDVGCSVGTALVAAQRHGWHAVGIEPSLPAAERARSALGLDVRTGTLAEERLLEAPFDAVLLHHVLEHVDGPEALLAEARQALAPGGLLYVALPNHGSLKAKLLGRHWSYGVTDEHLSHFTKQTLRRLVRRLGFTVLAVETRSYRADPRLLWDVVSRLRLRRWLERKCGLPPGTPMDPATYVAFLARTKWALWLCNRAWPAGPVSRLGLGEDLHLLARRT